MTHAETLDTAIVGAGPYGLSVAAHAKARGIRARVYGTPMQTWDEHVPTGARLKSECWALDLSDPDERYTLEAFCRLRDLPYQHAVPVPVPTFVEYGRWFHEQTAPDLHEARVTRIGREGTSFVLETADGARTRARSVVLAAGVLPFVRVPRALENLSAPCLRHSSELHDLSGFRGRRVAVVGAGQSAIETAVLLDGEGADVTLISRTPELIWNTLPAPLDRPRYQKLRHPDSALGPGWRNKAMAEAPGLFRRLPAARRAVIAREALGPAGSWWLRDRFTTAFGTAKARIGTEVISAKPDGDGARLELLNKNGTGVLDVDHVIAATGYEADVRALTFLDEPLRAQVRGTRGRAGAPVLGSGFESSVPGLHVVGPASATSFGPVMRFVCGSGYTSRRVAEALSRRALAT